MASRRKPHGGRYRRARPSTRPEGNRRHAQREAQIASNQLGDGPWRMCHTSDGEPKRRYLSRSEAKAAMRIRPERADLNVYRCTVCGYLHIGHRTPSQSPR